MPRYKKRKKAWDLTNPLYRYLHGVKRHKKRGGKIMARRYRRRGYGRSSGKKLFGLGTKGLIGNFGLLGVAGAALFSDQIANRIPVAVPFKTYGVAYAIGGPAGIAAKIAKDMFMPTIAIPQIANYP